MNMQKGEDMHGGNSPQVHEQPTAGPSTKTQATPTIETMETSEKRKRDRKGKLPERVVDDVDRLTLLERMEEWIKENQQQDWFMAENNEVDGPSSEEYGRKGGSSGKTQVCCDAETST